MTASAAAINPQDLFALLLWQEARGEPRDGRAAVAQVVKNRMAAHYSSDGTLQGTILWPEQFSGMWFDFQAGKYRRVAWTADQALALAASQLAEAKANITLWNRLALIAQEVLLGKYVADDPETFAKLSPSAVLYDNLAVSQPPWAVSSNLVAVIGHHSFFHA